MTKKQLIEKVAELEARIKLMENAPKQETHNHNHYHHSPAEIQPYRLNRTPWDTIITCDMNKPSLLDSVHWS